MLIFVEGGKPSEQRLACVAGGISCAGAFLFGNEALNASGEAVRELASPARAYGGSAASVARPLTHPASFVG